MKQSRFAPTLVAVLFYSAIPHTLLGTTTNLVPIADTALRSSVPDNNFGAVTPLPIGVAPFGSPANNCLFKFNLQDIPSNAVINSVAFRLFVTNNPTAAADFDVNRLLQDWGEGSGTNQFSHNGNGSPAAAGEATWNSRFSPSTPWGAGGGQAGTDFVTTPSATAMLTAGPNDFTSPGLVSDVQLWLQKPGTNFGWIVLATGGASSTGKLVASREDPDKAPTLIVDYSLPSSSAAPPTIFGMSLVGNQVHFSFNAESNRTYAVEFRNSLLDGDWSVLTNIPAQLVDATINITNAISSPQRFYRTRTP
jgi:hypothetical protein